VRKKFIQEKYSCKKKVYENCKIYGPDGAHLCNCNTKKAMWYVHKNLGKIIYETDALKVQLHFQPNSDNIAEQKQAPAAMLVKDTQGMGDLYNEQYNLVDRENRCVVCGSDKNYARYNIVPVLYRSHFPNTYKSHSNHDVMLLCLTCQEGASKYQFAMKKYVAWRFDIGLQTYTGKKLLNQKINRIKWATGLIGNVGDKLPEDRRADLVAVIKRTASEEIVPEWILKELEQSTVSPEALRYCREDLTPFKLNNRERLNPHGKEVVHILTGDKPMPPRSNVDPDILDFDKIDSHFNEKELNISNFIKIWRKMFISELQPKYMPNGWKIDHVTKRTFGENSVFNE